MNIYDRSQTSLRNVGKVAEVTSVKNTLVGVVKEMIQAVAPEV